MSDLERALELLDALVDDDRCMYDHNAFCQSHYSGEPGRECSNGQAVKFLAQMGVERA